MKFRVLLRVEPGYLISLRAHFFNDHNLVKVVGDLLGQVITKGRAFDFILVLIRFTVKHNVD